MNRKIILVAVLAALSANARAADDANRVPGEARPMDTGLGRFILATPNIPLVLQALERGFPLVGQLDEKETKKPEGSGDSSYAKIIEAQNKRLADLRDGAITNQKETGAEAKRLSEWRKKALSGQLGAEQATPKEASKPLEVTKVLPFNVENRAKFLECADGALSLLKARLSAQARGDVHTALQIEAALSSERGDGKTVSPEGIACGRYLGKVGIPVPKSFDEIRWLSAFMRLPNEGQDAAWRTFFLFGKALRLETSLSAHFWQYAWRRTAFSMTFHGRRIPDLKSLLIDYFEAYSPKRVTTPNAKPKRVVRPEEVRPAVFKEWEETKDLLVSN